MTNPCLLKQGIRLAVAGWLALAGSGRAVPVPLVNPSFEDQKMTLVPAVGNWTTGMVPGWTVTGGAGLYRPGSPLAFVPDGDVVLFLDSGGTAKQALWFAGAVPVTATPGLPVTVTLRGRERSGAAASLQLTLQTTAGTPVAPPFTLPIPANATGYEAVATTLTLPSNLGTSAGQPLELLLANSSNQLNLDLISVSTTPPASIDSFTATPATATAGQAVTLAWTVANADQLTLDGTDVSGLTTIAVFPSVSSIYTLTATGAFGSVSRKATVLVQSPTLRLNEVMAANSHTLQDEDGAWSDWIELHNPAPRSVALDGLYLTDDRSFKSKWAFPVGVSIAPNGYLVVFASSKNRRVPGSNLHTNFSLSNGGEYLALIATDGSTVISAFSPAFPGLSADLSYGLGTGPATVNTTLVPTGSTARYLVPGAPVAEAWRGGAPFDEAAWAVGAFDFGYAGPGPDQTAYTAAAGATGTQNYGGSLGMDFVVNAPVTVTEVGCFDSDGNGIGGAATNLRVQLFVRNPVGTPNDPADDTGGAALLSTPVSFTQAAPGTLLGAHRFKRLETPLTLTPGSYTLVSWGYNSSNPNGNNSAGFSTPNPGGGLLTFTGHSRYTGAAGGFPGNLDSHATQYGAGSFIYHGNSGTFATNTSATMKNINASLLTRYAFTVEPASSYSSLSLRISANDGYVAWLNGVEIARHNAPAVLLHNSTATATGPVTDRLAVPPERLAAGPNILAVQGLNATAGDEDFQLDVGLSGISPTPGVVYFATPTPGAANGSGTFADHVIINEIHSDPPASKSQWVEFIELYNPLTTPVDLSGWSFSKGISYQFPNGSTIPAGGYLVIAENPAHLEQFLGVTGAAGPWTGSLADTGEEIVLANAAGVPVDRVNYELGFPWPTVGGTPATSIQRIHEGLDSNLGGSWRSGPPTPGAPDMHASRDVPPAIRQVTHSPPSPASGQAVTVTARITDPEGVGTVTLEYQDVAPGAYLRLTDPGYPTAWTALAMRDDGTGGDAVADDDLFTACVPGAIQQHRHLIRYRISARDQLLNEVRVPYADDPCPNFAWFCYHGVPAWTGAVRPGTTAAAAFDAATMAKVRPWHLLSQESDVLACQYSNSDDGIYRYEGALVIGDRVHDHVRYRVKGQNSTFVVGKNKWKFKFNLGHDLQLPDDRGQGSSTVDTLNLSALTEPWAAWNRGLAGLDEAVAFKLYNLAGVPAPRTSFVQWRVIDSATEHNPGDQYDGDLWGLYLAFGNLDNHFKDTHGLPDGNLFQLQSGQNELTGQGRGQPGDLSDLNAFISGYSTSNQTEAWFRTNLNLTGYASWRAVTEAVNNTDRREQENVVYFRAPSEGRWQIHPWDCDLLYEPFDRWGPQGTQNASAYERLQNCLKHPSIRIHWQNRCRELQDLLLNPDQAWKVMDETVAIVANEPPRLIPADPMQPGYAINSGFIEVDRRMWDWHPQATSKGLYYQTPHAVPNMGNGPPQPFYRKLASGDFSGMLKWTKDFIASDPHGGGRLTAMAAGTVNPLTLATGEPPAAIPATPNLSYGGPPGFPSNKLILQSSSFQAAGGTGFAAMQWRIGEIHDPTVPGFDPALPWIYEISNLWASPDLTSFSATITPPATYLVAGRTYRARVRHQNLAGHWSHWSPPLEFTAGAAVPGSLATDLVISEIMYNPPEGADLEFIELRNISTTSPLTLDGLRFTAGINFVFPTGLTLAPGATMIVVRNRAAFEAKYGTALDIAGETLTSNLDNSGETLTLSLGPLQILRSVPYDDAFPWPTGPDGSGASLVLIAPQTNPDHANPLNWRAGTTTPGTTDATSYPDWKLAHGLTDDGDIDADAIPNFMEYALGGDPAVSQRAILPVFNTHPDRSFTVTLTRALRADDVGWGIEFSANLTDWQPVVGTLLKSRSATTTTETFTLTVPAQVPDSGTVFYRIRFAGK